MNELPDKYWETHWEVSAWNTSIDEPVIEFFATEAEADTCAASLREQGFADVMISRPLGKSD